jgi:hypothetical protein
MRSARSRVVRVLAWSWMAMACAACVLWWCDCGTGMRLVLAGNGPGRDFLLALPGRIRPVPGPAAWAGPGRHAGSRSVAAGGVSRRGCRCWAFTAGGGYLLSCQDAG